MKRFVFFVMLSGLISCQRDFTVKTNANESELVVEGYINNESRLYNYVLLTRSQDYFAADTAGLVVNDAVVVITPGDAAMRGGVILWDTMHAVTLVQQGFGGIPNALLQGIYSDPRLNTDSSHALLGEPGRFYRLDVDVEGNHYSAVTSMPGVVPIDSISVGYYFNDKADSNKRKAQITVYYQDPDTIGNAELFFRRSSQNYQSFGWGGYKVNGRLNNDDALINGQYVRLTVQQSFAVKDTVTMHMASVDRAVYNFWDSFMQASNNDGPFATPVVLQTNLTGANVTGCFSGFSISSKTVTIK